MTSITDFSLKASIGVVKRVPSGYLPMGSRFHLREKRKSVFVAEFEMAQTPVTVNQYAAFLNSGGVRQEHWWDQEGWVWVQGSQFGWGRENRWQPDAWEIQRQFPYQPVSGVTLFEAKAYCSWVSNETKRLVRLPTEEEWEWAARGDDQRPFPWGEVFDPGRTNTLESDRNGKIDVASIDGDESPFGIRDMAGNTQEWTVSPYQPLAGEKYISSDLFVARGGSYNDTAYGARTSFRRAYPGGYFFPFLGFRVVVSQR